MTRLATTTFDHAQPKIFDKLLACVNLNHQAKDQAVSLIRFGYMVDKKILQSDWLRTFWPKFQLSKNFPKYGICAGTRQII